MAPITDRSSLSSMIRIPVAHLPVGLTVVAAVVIFLSCALAIPTASASPLVCMPEEVPGDFNDFAAELRFDDESHRRWYRRFWTGNCKGLPIFQCWPGDPNWNGLIERLTDSVPAVDQVHLKSCLWELGRLMGHEWSRDNDSRRINTNDVSRWNDILEETADVEKAIAEIFTAVHTKLE